MKSVKKAVALALTVTMALGLVACGGGNDNQQQAEKTYKDTVVWAQGADITSLDPHQGKETTAVQVTNHIFDTLFIINENDEVEGQICESWEQVDDITYNFKIREGIKFHDGSDLTAEDVKFSLDRAIASAAVSYIVDFIDTVEITGDYSVKVTLDAPYAPALRNLAVPFSAIVPSDVVSADEEAFKLNPIGSGPYKFVEWKQSDSCTITAFDEYYAGAPATKNLVMKVIPEASQRTIALETGDIDLAYDIVANDRSKVAENENLTLFEAPSLTCYYVSMNMNKAPFNDQRVRQAINYAIDRQTIVDTIMYGYGQPADDIIAPAVFGYAGSGVYEFDQEKAKALLAEAGYADGFACTLYVNDNQGRVEVCQAIQAMLKEIGIDVKIEIQEFGTFISNTTGGAHDMAYFGWVTSTKDGDYTYYSLEHSSQQGAAGNRTFINDPEVDALVEAARTTTDVEARMAAYTELSAKLKEIANNAPILYEAITAGGSNKVEGFVLDPIGYHDLSNVKVAE